MNRASRFVCVPGHVRRDLFLEGYQRYLLELAGWRYLGQLGVYPTEWREPVRSVSGGV